MDGFKSIIYHVPNPSQQVFDFVPGGSTSLEGAEMDTDEIFIDAEAIGWNDGGLARVLHQVREKGGHALYFRGAALFDNIDDAKNHYLMDPWWMRYDEDEDEEHIHVPFGMVIPQWNFSYVPGDPHSLSSVTIIFFWQEQ